jgi:hypothetical protein
LLPAPDLGASHALLQLQLWSMLQRTKSLLQFFDFFIFCQLAWAIIFFNFVPTKSGRQGKRLGFLEKVEIKWTGQTTRLFYKSTFSDEQGKRLRLFDTHQFR